MEFVRLTISNIALSVGSSSVAMFVFEVDSGVTVFSVIDLATV